MAFFDRVRRTMQKRLANARKARPTGFDSFVLTRGMITPGMRQFATAAQRGSVTPSTGTVPFQRGPTGIPSFNPFNPFPRNPFEPTGPSGPTFDPQIPGGNGGAIPGACEGIDNWLLRQACREANQFAGGGCGPVSRLLGLCSDDSPGAAPGGGGGMPVGPSGGGNGGCPPDRIRVGDNCVAPGDAFPGGDPFTTPAGGRAVQGSFGLPAISPVVEQRPHRSCPTGMVLGKDNLCYPRQILPRNSRFRKWRPGQRPPISAGDWKALKRMKSTKRKARDIAETAGGKVKGLPRG